MNKNIKAIILAAGEGKRLRPYTTDRPKCLVELGGTPLLEHQIQTLKHSGISDITIVTGYQAEKIDALGYPTIHNPQYNSTNMVASLMCARDCFRGDADILITYGDIVYEPRVLEPILSCKEPISALIDLEWHRLWTLRSHNVLSDAETLKMDRERNILELGKKPQSIEEIEGQYMGVIKVRKDFAHEFVKIYDMIDSNVSFPEGDRTQMYMTTFLQYLIDTDHPVKAVPVSGGWLEIDTLTDLEKYNLLYQEQKLNSYFQLAH